MKYLILVRGISGSGKSTFAKKLKGILETTKHRVVHYETDDYFMNDGVYKFNTDNVHKFHTENQKRTFDALNNPYIDVVIVSNTFVKLWELKPYMEYALNNNVKVLVYEMEQEFKNKHDVPKEHIERMKNRFTSKEKFLQAYPSTTYERIKSNERI